MYESERKFSIRGLIVTILLIILIICVLLWIFPIKKNKNDIKEITYSEKFNTNIKILENAGRAYYYKATLPTKNNTSKKINLEKLIQNKMLNTLYDSNGKSCNNTASYVELTKKNDKEFDLKSHLKCDNEENEIVSTLYCEDTKSKCKTTKVVSKTETKNIKTESSNATYRYLYSCTDKYNIYSDWSSWSTTYVSSTDTREVQTKTEKEKKYVKTGTKKEAKVTYVKKKVTETVLEEEKWVNTKPANAKSCYSIPKSNYTIYVCEVEVTKEVEKEVPVTTYENVDVYGYQDVVTTYYRYRTVDKKTNNYTYWSENPNNEYLINNDCTIIKSEKVNK